MESGENFTGSTFNKVLKKLLSPYVDYNKGKVTSHSYRAGLATMMAKCGYSDAEIMTTGEYILAQGGIGMYLLSTWGPIRDIPRALPSGYLEVL